MVKKRKTRDALLEDSMMPHTGKGNVNMTKVRDSISSKKMIGLETLLFKIVKNIGVGAQLKASTLQALHCK